MRVAPKVALLRYTDPDRLSLAKAAAIFLGKTDVENVKRPINMLYHTPPHKSIFRGETIRFEFVTSKVVYDHLVTYTTATVRACAGLRANKAGDFVTPLEVVGTDLEDVIERTGLSHLENYNAIIRGIDPETKDPMKKARLQAARSIAPMSVNLHYVLEYNFLTFMESIFVQRLWAPGAQPDTNEVVRMMWDLVHDQDPELWDAAYDIFGPEALAWQNLRLILKKKGITVDDLALALDQVPWTDQEAQEKNTVPFLLEQYGGLKSMWDKKA